MNKFQILSVIARNIELHYQTAPIMNCSVLGGDAGNAIFMYYYSMIEPKYRCLADNYIDSLLKQSRYCKTSSYCNGRAGFGIALTFLERDGFVSGVMDALSYYDIILEKELENELRNNMHDFLHGFIGIGFYFLHRYKMGIKAAKAPLLQLSSYLCTKAEVCNRGIRWRLNDKPDRIYNISLSHGMSSTLLLLANIYKYVGFAKELQKQIYHTVCEGVRYILSQVRDPRINDCYFPSTSFDCSSASYSRLGWCYGDLGIAISLLNISEIINDRQLNEKSLEILSYNSVHRRNLQKSAVFDACICHGASGIAQMFLSLTKYGIKDFYDANKYWHKITLDMGSVGSDNAIYKYFTGITDGYKERLNILDGATGVGLYLIESIGISTMLPELLLLKL